jgi:hypothetical protein
MNNDANAAFEMVVESALPMKNTASAKELMPLRHVKKLSVLPILRENHRASRCPGNSTSDGGWVSMACEID